MKPFPFAAVAGLLLSLSALGGSALAASGAGLEALKPPVCGERKSCQIFKLWPAGRAPADAALAVAEVHLGLADKPEDAPEDGCRAEEGGNDGGREYWLIEGERPPRLILALCNDGYGSSGRGQDVVEIGDNRMSRLQLGGSNDRWQAKRIIQLSPQKSLAVAYCGYRASEAGTGAMTWIEIASLAARSLALDGSVFTEANQSDDPCELLEAHKGPGPDPGFLAGIDVPITEGSTDPAQPAAGFPEGTVLGGCAASMLADGKTAFVAYGTPDAARVAELRFMALDPRTLVLQLYDPRPDKSAAASWIGMDHVEIWTTLESQRVNRPDPAKLAQLGVGLDGSVHAGAGKARMPTVAHWQARDEKNRPVTVIKLRWAEDDALAGGLLVALSQAEDGRQTRIFATGQIVRNRPQYLPDLAAVPVSCADVAGRWEVTANPGELGGSEN